jgi:hypothetical protein
MQRPSSSVWKRKYRPIGFSMPQTKQMRGLGCFSMMLPSWAACVIASTRGLGKPLRSRTPMGWHSFGRLSSAVLELDLAASWDESLLRVAASDLTKSGSRCTIDAPWTSSTTYIRSAKLNVQWLKVGISQPFGYAMPNLFSIGNPVDRPK